MRWLRKLRALLQRKQEVPSDARWVVEMNKCVLVTPGETKVVVEDTVYVPKELAMSRQNWLDENGHTNPKVTGRAWLVSQLPDACVFL